METGIYEIKNIDALISRPDRKVGILGGTFNPPHIAHLDIALKVRLEFGLDEIMLIPVGIPPHKRYEYIAGNEDRENMVRLTAAEHDFLSVCTLELNRPGYTYTIDTLRELKRTMADCVFYYIIGSDTLFTMDMWKDFNEVVKLTKFICICRPGDTVPNIVEKIKYYKKNTGVEIYFSKNIGLNLSSTLIRQRIKKGESVRGLVINSVANYMEKYDVYR